jgi:DNA-binding NarL/FixJ family response regulator
LVLSVSAEEADVTDAIVAGASGYVLKDRPHHEIVAGIRAAAAGQSPVSPRIAAMLVRRLREDGITGQRGFRGAIARLDGRHRPSHWLRRRW